MSPSNRVIALNINAKATGGMRQIQYKLKAGEAGWILVPGRVEEY